MASPWAGSRLGGLPGCRGTAAAAARPRSNSRTAALPAGQGGTGDTWQFKELKTGRDVAVKFIKRPLPKVLQTNILREFTVSSHTLGNLPVGRARASACPPCCTGQHCLPSRHAHKPADAMQPCRQASLGELFAHGGRQAALQRTCSCRAPSESASERHWGVPRMFRQLQQHANAQLQLGCPTLGAGSTQLAGRMARMLLPPLVPFPARPPALATPARPPACLPALQIQADLGFGNEHVIKAYEAVLTPSHLCLCERRGQAVTASTGREGKRVGSRVHCHMPGPLLACCGAMRHPAACPGRPLPPPRPPCRRPTPACPRCLRCPLQ